MAREVFFPNPESRPSGYSPATRVGDTIFVSGQVALDGDGKLVGAGDCGAQAAQCLRNVGVALEAAGGAWDDVVKVTTFLVEVADYDAYAAARLAMFPENGPASSTVVIAALVKPEFLIEIEAVAVLGGSAR
jgi:enamine deaminase RidA (YjgF/YER057c/UK114 family)